MPGNNALVPITLVTGFLGSGKTTILAHVLGQDGFERTCAIINEFGDIGLDHELIEASDDDVILLAKGCLCCTIRGSLGDTLRDILKRQKQGRLGPIDRIVVETTGLADPFPVVQMLNNDSVVSANYRVDGVVTLIDAEQGPSILESRIEAVRQVLAADRIILTKMDLADPQSVESVKQAVLSLNDAAEVTVATHGIVSPDALFDVQRTADSEAAAHDTDSENKPHLDVTTFVIGFEEPLTPERIGLITEALQEFAGPQLWRAKGLLWSNDGRPSLVNVVGSRVHPLQSLALSPSGEPVSRLIFIVAPDLRPVIESRLAALGGHYASGNAFEPD